MDRLHRGLVCAILAAGVALRLALALAIPPDRAYDDHYEPVRIMLDKGVLPSAADCWECYQPPLYYVISAGPAALARSIAAAMGAPDTAEQAARRALQIVSFLAGCATLWVCRLILRRFPELTRHEALGLAFVAFLPRHVYMSAMATNDALTYLAASLAVYAALRTHAAGWPTRGCVLTGLAAGTAVLCKGYGWVTVAAILLLIWLFTRVRGTTPPRRELTRPLLLTAAAAFALGIWLVARNVWIYEHPHVDNFEMFPETPMRYQPPGSIGQTSFASLRCRDLLTHPWVHVTHVDSFWTQLYARLWFDYEGFNTTLGPYPPWSRLWDRCATAEPAWNGNRWDMLLSYADDEVPPGFRRVAVVAYIAGAPLTLAVLCGLVLAALRARRDFRFALILVHALFALSVPLVQTLRLPHFAAMKAAFALSSLTSAAVLAALPVATIRHKCCSLLLAGGFWLLLAAIAATDIAYVVLQFTWPPAP
ncbi:MAG: hypothetical protein PVJ57_16450 [Phycisphaerae bacterium]|jgi:hypothetical protein